MVCLGREYMEILYSSFGDGHCLIVSLGLSDTAWMTNHKEITFTAYKQYTPQRTECFGRNIY